MKKASSGRNLDANLEIMPTWKLSLFYSFKLTYAKIQEIARAYTAQTTKKAHFSRVSLSVYPRSRRGAERMRQGEERWSRPPKTALERSYLTEKSSSENRILRPRRKETPDRIPRRMTIYVCIYIYKKRETRQPKKTGNQDNVQVTLLTLSRSPH